MTNAYLAGPSHVTRWADDIRKNRVPRVKGVTLWGEAGLALFSLRLKENIERAIANGKDVWLMVPDFRFGIDFFKDHENFAETGRFVSGYGLMNKSLISEERDRILFENALSILDYYVEQYRSKIKFMFWCLAVREWRNLLGARYVNSDGVYKHPVWSYHGLLERYSGNVVDVWPITEDFDSYVIDQQGHPSFKAYSFIFNAFRLNSGKLAFDCVKNVYADAVGRLFSLIPESRSGPIAMEGDDGFLFLSGDVNRGMDQHHGRLMLNEEACHCWKGILSKRKEYFDAHGVKCYYLIAPDKNIVYFDRLVPPIAPVKIRPSSQWLALAESEAIEVCYPLSQLINARASGLEVYDAVDTHWNGFGAFQAYTEIFKLIGEEFQALNSVKAEQIEFSEFSYQGDLGSKVLPPKVGTGVKCSIGSSKSKLIFDNGIANRGNLKIFVNEDRGLPEAVFFGDSFHVAIIPFLAENFSRLTFVHRSDIDKYLLQSRSVDIVFFESVERFLISPPNDSRALPVDVIVFEKLKGYSAESIDALHEHLLAQVGPEAPPECFLYLGICCLVRRDFRSSIKYLSSIIDSELAQRACIYLWISYYEVGDFASAFSYFERVDASCQDVFSVFPSSTDVALVKRAMAAVPAWVGIRHHASKVYLVNKEFDVAIEFSGQVVSYYPNSWLPWYRHGQIYEGMNRIEDAVKAYGVATEIASDNSTVLQAYGNVLLKAGVVDVAVDVFRRAVMLSPSSDNLRFLYGISLLRVGKVDLAHQQFSVGIDLNPCNDSCFVQRGVVHRKSGCILSAIDDFRSALLINPYNRGAVLEVVPLMLSEGMLEEAYLLLSKLASNFLMDVEFSFLWARVNFSLRRFSVTRSIVSRILNIDSAHRGAKEILLRLSAATG